jgi:DNA-directed RNA polymerase specialized sigma24 family protein
MAAYEKGPLLDLMRLAIERAFRDCPHDDFVMLQLAHSDQLKLSELARMFGCSQATISRQLDRASKNLSKATMANVRELDSWIELGWDDFAELCRSASPACFGVVD